MGRAQQCVDVISKDICGWIGEIDSMGSQVSTDFMRRLWSSICKAAAVGDVPMPHDLTPGHALWPFIAQRLALTAAARTWPGDLYNALPSGADARAKTWLEAKLQDAVLCPVPRGETYSNTQIVFL